MGLSISLSSLIALLGAMLVLAAVPSVSVLAVTARAATLGFRHGVYTTLGIVLGDLIFILVAIFGLRMIAEAPAGLMAALRYAGAGYLVFLGGMLWRAKADAGPRESTVAHRSGYASFLAGLFITLGDQKAILFYLGFFPAFLALEAMTALDVILLMTTATATLLSVKLLYAWLAAQVGGQLGNRAGHWLNRLAACVLVAVGVALLLRG